MNLLTLLYLSLTGNFSNTQHRIFMIQDKTFYSCIYNVHFQICTKLDE